MVLGNEVKRVWCFWDKSKNVNKLRVSFYMYLEFYGIR